jgi:hypothetical protein
LDSGNPAEIFEDVLLAPEPAWENPAGRERHRGAEEGLQHEDALGVVPRGPVPDVGHVLLAFVEPLVQPEIFRGLTTVFLPDPLPYFPRYSPSTLLVIAGDDRLVGPADRYLPNRYGTRTFGKVISARRLAAAPYLDAAPKGMVRPESFDD